MSWYVKKAAMLDPVSDGSLCAKGDCQQMRDQIQNGFHPAMPFGCAMPMSERCRKHGCAVYIQQERAELREMLKAGDEAADD